MTDTANIELAKRMMLLARPAGDFRPTAYYDPDGDCIEFLARTDPFYAEPIDDLVMVYYGQQSGDVVGALIKGVTKFCKDFCHRNPGFHIVLQDTPVHLEYLFLARLWTSGEEPDAMQTLIYRKLIEIAAETAVDGAFSSD